MERRTKSVGMLQNNYTDWNGNNNSHLRDSLKEKRQVAIYLDTF